MPITQAFASPPDDGDRSPSDPRTTQAVTTTEPPEPTTTEAPTTTSPTDGPTEEAAIALVEDLLSVEWDEQGLGIGHNDEFFSSVSEDPILTRIIDGTSDRALAGNYLQGTVDETFISVSVAGTTASVVYCAIDNLTGFRSDGSVFLPPLETPILRDYQLRFDDLDGWKMTTFFVGEACQL